MNKTFFTYVLILAGCQLVINTEAQEIPIGQWRSHTSFNSVHAVSVGSGSVYAAADNGIFVLDLADYSVSTITKLDGLSSMGITDIASSLVTNQLLIGYADGNLDMISDNEISNYDQLKNSTTITGSKRINHILTQGGLAYLSTDYGLVVFDLLQSEVKETWRDLGPAGEKIKIYQSTVKGDSIFLATERGVLAGDLDDNLLDFNSWRRFATGVFNGNIQSITTFGDRIYAAINGSGIHKYQNGTWSLEPYLQGQSFKNIRANLGGMMITQDNSLYSADGLGNATLVTSDKIVKPIIAFQEMDGTRWIGDERNGLVSNKTGSYVSYIPNGPSFSGGLRLKYNSASAGMLAVSGGYSASFTPLSKTEYLNTFLSGSWTHDEVVMDDDLTDVEFRTNGMVVSSYGKGIEVIENGVITFQDATTSANVTAMASGQEGVWVTNFGSTQPLRLLKSNNTWEAFSFPSIAASRYPTEILVDVLGNVWMVLNPGNGGGILVFDPDANESVYLTEVSGAGGLPSELVYSISNDRDGRVWVGTAEGVAYFSSPASVFDPGINAAKPIFENRFLLRDEKITAIAVDGGNRKWIGTERGVWLFDPFGEKQVYNFNKDNSPLLSDKIVDIEINGKSGEVFFLTDVGMVSFRADATAGDGLFHDVKIFPNPVTSHFTGLVGISGLATDAYVKITDVSGKLIWQTQAHGGSVSWNVRDYNGRRAATGMYLVLATSLDGTESVVGKIAVVE